MRRRSTPSLTAPQVFNGDPRHKFMHGFSFWEAPRDWPEGLPAWLAGTRVSVQARMHGEENVYGVGGYSSYEAPTRTRITFG